uniref:Uncharacterized protein n=1 Tax=Strombidium inclinatum TaxID=197538 RepID=A0A7S3IHD0_9SPIT|mmetsp:Transcript_19181/g.29373  ORF Transcript_19181/g.29373 Transcript_19181/m.29373 type:complete len:111 (+) Transcript_19181:404-736(+)
MINGQFMGEETSKKLIAGIERGIQNENDEQIRILNERQLTGSAGQGDPSDIDLETQDKLRASLRDMRDGSYDFVENKGMLVNEDEEGEADRVYNTAKYVTMAAMRVARKL